MSLAMIWQKYFTLQPILSLCPPPTCPPFVSVLCLWTKAASLVTTYKCSPLAWRDLLTREWTVLRILMLGSTMSCPPWSSLLVYILQAWTKLSKTESENLLRVRWGTGNRIAPRPLVGLLCFFRPRALEHVLRLLKNSLCVKGITSGYFRPTPNRMNLA